MNQASSGLDRFPYRPAEFARLLGLAAVYAALAVVVLKLFAANGVVSIVRPSSGVALAALLLGGQKYAPGVWLGSFAGNLLAGSSPLIAAAIALGATLEALVGVWLLAAWRPRAAFDPALRVLRDLLQLILLGGFAAACVSALIGSSVLLASGLIDRPAYVGHLAHWWMGDVLGVALIAPLLLVWRHAPGWRSRGLRLEAALLLGFSFLVGQIVFLGEFADLFGSVARGYWMFLLVAWIGVRLGAHGVLALLAMTAVQALWGVHLGVGFFVGDMMRAQLTNYWGYMMVLTLVGMALAIYIESLKRSEQSLAMFSLAVEQSPGAILITDAQERIVFTNESFTQLTGYTPEEVLGQEPRLLQSGQTPLRTFVALWQTLTAGLSWHGEVINRCRNGKVFVAWQTISPLRQADGQISHYVSIMEDITERKRIGAELDSHRFHLKERIAERTAELSMAETRTRLILESTADGLFGTDSEGRISFVNPAACRLLGYSVEQLIGRPAHAILHHYRPDGTPFPLAECPVYSALFAGKTVRIEDDIFWCADGQPLAVALAGQPIFSEGQIVGTVLGFTEIGERKRVEAERAAALAEAQRLTRVKSEFLANMSHEIRTPLNAVLGLARIGMRENRGRKSGETCGQIFASGEHLLGVINDILDFSKIEAGKLSVEARAFALAGVTDQVMSFLSGSATDKGLPLHLALADDLPAWVLGDALRLRQVLVNLLGNAIKFTPQGEIRLTVTRCGDMTSFCVSDTGIGMRPEQLGRLFTAFEQADNSTTRLFGGTGLGLAISRQLARLMGGDIEASSSVGQGCVFTLRLPLPATAAPERLAEPLPRSGADAGPRLTGWRVLAAEDVAVNRLVLADLLEQEGAHVLFAENGREAIDQVRRAISGESPPFDLVLMDIQMPVMDGLQATCCLREIAPDLPVIGLTAHALAEERDRCLEAGMVDHVTKPIDPEELVAALLRHARARPAPPESAPPLPLAAALSPPPLADRPPIDWAALSERFQGRQAFIDKLIGLAIQSNRETPHKLRIAARQGNHAAISFIAHSLKGFCGNIHAKSAHELACQTEEAARAGSDNVPYLAECLAEQLVVLLAAMEARNGK